MTTIIQRFIRDRLSNAQGWDLIEWYLRRQGDEFSFEFMSLDGTPPMSHAQLRNDLRLFWLGTPRREHVTTLAGQGSPRATDTWRLCTENFAVLRRRVPDGFFAAPSYAAAGWLEDFTIYRQGGIMLGVVSHEGVVVLRLTEQEHGELSALAIESHESA